jgi:hypothetical protein
MEEFNFKGCVEITELLGIKADDELSLLEAIEDAPLDSIYYHTHSYFLRQGYLTGHYPNDFANWVETNIGDNVLAESLAIVTPFDFKNLEEIKSEFIEIIDRHLFDKKVIPFVTRGDPFHFMKSQIIEIPTGLKAKNLQEFIQALKVVDAGAIYNHIFEARLRSERRNNDFAIWIKTALGKHKLSEQIEKLDIYLYSLEAIRNKLLEICQRELKNNKQEKQS